VGTTGKSWLHKSALALSVFAVLALAGLVLSACGGSSDSSTQSESSSAPAETGETGGGEEEGGELTDISIGVVPSMSDAGPLVAEHEGFFEEEGIKANVHLIGVPTQSVPALLSNKVQVGYVSAPVAIPTAANGAPLQLIQCGEVAGTTAESDWFKVVAPKGSDIKSIKDLEGKNLAVGQLESLGTLSVSRALEKAGGDPSNLNFVVIPFPEMASALESGQVEAMWIGEPYLTQAMLKTPLQVVANPEYETVPNLPVSCWTMAVPYAEENPEVADKIRRVGQKTAEFLQTDEGKALARELVGDYLEIEPAVVKKMLIPPYVTEFPKAAFEEVENLELKYGYIDKLPDPETFLNIEEE
jgi:NitT/TauT family transport system substrate-binding protein